MNANQHILVFLREFELLNNNVCFPDCTEGPIISVNIVKKVKKDNQIIIGFCIMHKITIVLSFLATSSFKSIIVKRELIFKL